MKKSTKQTALRKTIRETNCQKTGSNCLVQGPRGDTTLHESRKKTIYLVFNKKTSFRAFLLSSERLVLKIHKSEFNEISIEAENLFIRDKSLVSLFNRFMFRSNDTDQHRSSPEPLLLFEIVRSKDGEH